MERYETLFAQLKNRQEGAFVPFVTLGDPGPEQSLKIIDALIEGGADALELGIPFSDPLADGPTIQGAALRAFAAGVTPAQCFEMLAAIRQKHPTIPIGLPDVCQPRLQPGHRCVLCPVRPRRRRLGAGGRRAGGRVRPVPPGGDAP